MGVIKDIYDVVKDGAAFKAKAAALRRALIAKLKLNREFLDEIEKSVIIDDDRRVEIIGMLDIDEITCALKYEIPYIAISRKKVSAEMASLFKIKRLKGADIEILIDKLHRRIYYLKTVRNYKNQGIDLNLRLINVYKYNRLLLELLK